MQARFFCKTGVLAGSEHRIGDHATIGRGPGNAIVLDSDLVSTNHARIAFDAAADAYFLEDLDSRNGTCLDGVPVADRERLGKLHVVTVAAHDFLFVVAPGEPPAASATGSNAASPAVAGVPATRGKALSGPPVPASPPHEDAEPATRHDAPSALAAPVLGREDEAPEPATRLEAPSALAAPALGLGDAPEPATRHEVPSALAAPALGPRDEAPEPATRYDAPSALAAPVLEGREAGSAPRKGDEDFATQALAAPPEAAPPEPPAGVMVEIRLPNAEPRRITLADGRHVLGRAKDCALPVDDRTLSRQHAALVVLGDRLTVTDLQSLNGTYLGERTVENATEVRVGKTVTLGDRVKVVRIDPARDRGSGTEA